MYPKAFITYLIHFHCDRDYFECHEILEEYWKETDLQQDRVWVGLIQLAVSFYHYRRKNFSGAEKMMKKAIHNLNNTRKRVMQLGINDQLLLELMQQSLIRIQHRKPYKSVNLPIIDKKLAEICQKTCIQMKLSWGKESNMSNSFLIHKHMLRDRSTVITLREQMKRQKNRLS